MTRFWIVFCLEVSCKAAFPAVNRKLCSCPSCGSFLCRMRFFSAPLLSSLLYIYDLQKKPRKIVTQICTHELILQYKAVIEYVYVSEIMRFHLVFIRISLFLKSMHLYRDSIISLIFHSKFYVFLISRNAKIVGISYLRLLVCVHTQTYTIKMYTYIYNFTF